MCAHATVTPMGLHSAARSDEKRKKQEATLNGGKHGSGVRMPYVSQLYLQQLDFNGGQGLWVQRRAQRRPAGRISRMSTVSREWVS